MDLLSICIPTYNNKVFLRKLLNLLVKHDISNIKIIVVDNASTDGTDVMMQDFKSNSQIIYMRNERNLGFDLNVLRLVEEGSKYSKYSLWIGDDDAPNDDFFQDIPEILEKNNPDMVVLNCTFFKIKDTMFYLEKDYIENDFIKFSEKILTIPFGTFIVKNDLLVTKNAKTYLGTIHMQIGVLCESMFDKFKKAGKIKAYITAKPYIAWRNREASYDDSIMVNRGKTFALFPNDIKKAIKYIILKLFIVENIRSQYDRKKYIWMYKTWQGYTKTCKELGETIDDHLTTLNELLFKYEILKEYNNDFAIWGSGDFGIRCMNLLASANNKIKYFIDNDISNQGNTLDGIPIISFDKFNSLLNKPRIIIAISPGKGGYDVIKQFNSTELQYIEDYILFDDFCNELAEKVIKYIEHGEQICND